MDGSDEVRCPPRRHRVIKAMKGFITLSELDRMEVEGWELVLILPRGENIEFPRYLFRERK